MLPNLQRPKSMESEKEIPRIAQEKKENFSKIDEQEKQKKIYESFNKTLDQMKFKEDGSMDFSIDGLIEPIMVEIPSPYNLRPNAKVVGNGNGRARRFKSKQDNEKF